MNAEIVRDWRELTLRMGEKDGDLAAMQVTRDRAVAEVKEVLAARAGLEKEVEELKKEKADFNVRWSSANGRLYQAREDLQQERANHEETKKEMAAHVASLEASLAAVQTALAAAEREKEEAVRHAAGLGEAVKRVSELEALVPTLRSERSWLIRRGFPALGPALKLDPAFDTCVGNMIASAQLGGEAIGFIRGLQHGMEGGTVETAPVDVEAANADFQACCAAYDAMSFPLLSEVCYC